MNPVSPSDRALLRRRCARAATVYERHDALARAVADNLFGRLDFHPDEPQRVLDVGAGDGRGSAALKQRWPRAQVIALDFALPMLHAARKHLRWRRPFARVCADACALPLPDHVADVLYANLCFAWIDDLSALFAECARALRPGGLLAFTTFGPDTLRELRAAGAQVDDGGAVMRQAALHDVGDAMLAAGLRDPVLDVERYTLTYATPADLFADLRGMGIGNVDPERRRSLTGKRRFRRMLDAYQAMRREGHFPASFEIITAHAFGPAPGQPRRDGAGEIASFSVERLRGARR
jgi:malonyl-CoA O-methyltransferase